MRLNQKISDRRGIATAAVPWRERRLFAAVAAVLAGTWGAAAGHAASGDLFAVENVSVDATAESATAAREVAMGEGYQQAFQRLITRLVPRDRQADIPPQPTGRLTTIVRDFEVANEKTSPVRYLANLTIRFNRTAVRDLLRGVGVPYAETQSKPLVVVPVLERAGAYLLWDNPNPWRDAWSSVPDTGGLVPLVVPAAGIQNLSVISAEQAVRADRGRLAAIARRYGADGALVAIARPSFGAGHVVRSVEVAVFRTNDPQRRTWRNTIAAGDAEGEPMMVRAARETAAFVQEQWKGENLLHFDQQNEIVVSVPIESLEDWVVMRRRLAEIAAVAASDLIALSRRSATVRLRYMGGEEQLRTALAHSDLTLLQGPETPVLQFRGRNNAGAGFGSTNR